MIQYFKHTDIDKHKWNTLIEHSPQQQVYALSWYLDVVSPGWEALIIVNSTNDYQLGMPLPVKSKFKIKYLEQPLFCQQLGIYALQPNIPVLTYQALTAIVFKQFRYVISLQFNTDNILPTIESNSFKVINQVEHTHYLNLHCSYNLLYKGYNKDRKNNLKRAKKAALQLEESKDLEPLITFFKQEVAHRIYGGVAESAYQMLRKLFYELDQRGLAFLIYTKNFTGQKNAGCLFIKFNHKIIYIYNAASFHGRKLNGRTLILDYVIQRFAGQNYILDFESPSEKEKDITDFYKSFGSMPVAFQSIKYNNLPMPIKYLKQLRVHIIRKYF